MRAIEQSTLWAAWTKETPHPFPEEGTFNRQTLEALRKALKEKEKEKEKWKAMTSQVNWEVFVWWMEQFMKAEENSAVVSLRTSLMATKMA